MKQHVTPEETFVSHYREHGFLSAMEKFHHSRRETIKLKDGMMVRRLLRRLFTAEELFEMEIDDNGYIKIKGQFVEISTS